MRPQCDFKVSKDTLCHRVASVDFHKLSLLPSSSPFDPTLSLTLPFLLPNLQPLALPFSPLTYSD